MIWHPCQKLTINVRIYFWTFSSIPVINIANLMPVLYLLFICSSVLSFVPKDRDGMCFTEFPEVSLLPGPKQPHGRPSISVP